MYSNHITYLAVDYATQWKINLCPLLLVHLLDSQTLLISGMNNSEKLRENENLKLLIALNFTGHLNTYIWERKGKENRESYSLLLSLFCD